MDPKKIIKISDYYKDYNLPKSYFDSNSIRNLLELSAINNISIFDENKKNKYKIKSKKKIIKECQNLKKIKIKELRKELNNYTSQDNIDSERIIDVNNKFVNNLESIDSIINIVNKDDNINIDKLNKLITDSDEFIEIFSN
jgi:esterase/lipase